MSESTSILDISGRVALVTGAGQGVGRAIAKTLAANNAACVVVNDYFEERAQAVAEDINAAGGKAIACGGDVSDLESVQDMVAKVTKDTGPINILINNAGNAGPTGFPSELPSFWETDPSQWDMFFSVNLFGVMNCCHAMVPGMLESGYGRIVTIISDAGREGEPRLAAYCAAKAGAAGFIRALAKELGRYQITANCVSISSINNPQLAAQAEAFGADMMKKRLSGYTIRRFGEPEEIAGLVSFLSSPSASWITGQTYPVNGGYSTTK